MCRALAQSGTDTLLATTDADGPGRLAVTTAAVAAYQGADTIFFPRQLTESFKWSAPLAAWLAEHVAEFDLVHIHAVFSHSSLAAARACRASRVPYVVRPLGTLDPWSRTHHRFRKQALMLCGAGRMLRGAVAMHYTARQEQHRTELGLPWLPRGIVVPLGVDDDWLAGDGLAKRAEPPTVVAMSRLDNKKGVDLLIAAFHQIAAMSRASDWRLVIGGDGSPRYVEMLRRLAQAGPARDRIEFRGWVRGAERRALLHSARLFVLPSLQENFGIALVEAMACGVPVVVSPGVNLSAEIELAGAGWVSERTPAALAESLQTAMSSPDALHRSGIRAREFAERFRWAEIADRLRSMYDAVLLTPHFTSVETCRAAAAPCVTPDHKGHQNPCVA
jgi:glycosyltransferase involved in cell wall biosynthesis